MTSYLKTFAAYTATLPTVEYVNTFSARYASDTDNPSITVPVGSMEDDWIIVGLVGQALAVTSIGGGGSEVAALVDHGTETGTSGRDYEITVWKYQLSAGDISAGTIATVLVNARCMQAVVVTGAVSTITASAIAAVDGANDLATPAMTPTGASSCLVSFMGVFNATGDAIAPSNMTAAGTAYMSTDDRVLDAAYVDLTSTSQFTPAIWDGTASVDYMGYSILAQEAA